MQLQFGSRFHIDLPKNRFSLEGANSILGRTGFANELYRIELEKRLQPEDAVFFITRSNDDQDSSAKCMEIVCPDRLDSVVRKGLINQMQLNSFFFKSGALAPTEKDIQTVAPVSNTDAYVLQCAKARQEMRRGLTLDDHNSVQEMELSNFRHNPKSGFLEFQYSQGETKVFTGM